ncbi:predicted protein [Nematostella vectensis]|uniref:SGNH hydrolase-type esterase domain-containing protein n=1 Tax=Nematostella vectensis TaxID=45351 RepID=A7REU6_NEMVE|nr:predicted protein [Nematostella vectensis]|eukprot:XP_001641912.1 predicted protein [Nematostella vectensis]
MAGDSIVKFVKGWELANSGRRVSVRPFPGATVAAMNHYVQPIIDERPDKVILHVGTNDLRNMEPQQIVDSITDIGRGIQANSPDTDVVISALLQRCDSHEFGAKVKETNRILRSFANQNGWSFLPNANINSSHLNSRGLHLNPQGINSTDSIVPNLRGFKMALLNIVSLPNHIDEIRIMNMLDNVDVFGFNETRLDETVTNGEMNIPGFDIIRKDRKRNGGGVCLYVRDSHNYRIRNDLVPEDLEAVCVEIIKPNSKPFIVCTVYRPFIISSREFFVSFENLIKNLDNLAIEFHLLGDLNGNMLSEVPTYEAKIFKRIYQTYQLSQLITKPTRITKSSKSLLDHYVTNSPEKIVKTGVIQTGLSDHGMIFGIRKINYKTPLNSKPKIIEIRNMKRFNEQRFIEDLGKQPWHMIALMPDTESMWSCWKTLFLEVLDKYAPLPE